MKKNECGVARDLMPLVLDRVASDESRNLVEEHISACPECKKQYEEMKSEMPEGDRAEYEKEQKKIVDAMRAVRKKRIKRRLTAIALAFIVCVVAAFGGMLLYDRLYNRTVQVENDLYSVSLSRLQDGRIVITADPFGVYFNQLSSNLDEHREDGAQNLYVYLGTTPLHQTSADKTFGPYCMGILEAGAEEKLHEIRQGKPGDSVTIWKAGDPIPDASGEMEKYFALDAQFDVLLEANATEEGKVAYTSEIFHFQDRLEEARQAVPEWK